MLIVTLYSHLTFLKWVIYIVTLLVLLHIPNGVIVTTEGCFSRFLRSLRLLSWKSFNSPWLRWDRRGSSCKRSSVNPAKGIYCLNRCKIWNWFGAAARRQLYTHPRGRLGSPAPAADAVAAKHHFSDYSDIRLILPRCCCSSRFFVKVWHRSNYRVTIQVVLNLSLTSKQKFRFSMRPMY